MSKIVLDDVASGYNLSKVNENFQKIEDALNNQVLYRDAPEGEPNTLEDNIDANNKSIYNASSINTQTLRVGGVLITPGEATSLPYPNPSGQAGKVLASDGVDSYWAEGNEISSIYEFKHKVSNSVTRTYKDKAQEGTLNLNEFISESDRTANYLAPLSIDFTSQINTWLSFAGTYPLEFDSGFYKFTNPINIVAKDSISIRGKGNQQSFLVYSGASTSSDIITIGNGSTSFRGLDLKDFNIDSTTTMTGGASLRIRKCQNGNKLKGISFGKLNTSKKLWDGVWFDNTNVTSYSEFEINVLNDGIVVNGVVGSDSGSDLVLDKGTITYPQIGIHCAGGFGGLYVGSVLVYGALTSGFKSSNSKVARGNREIILSRESVFDASNSYNIHINDPLSNSSIVDISAFVTGAGWITPTVGDGIFIESLPVGRVSIQSSQIKANVRHGINISDTSTFVIVDDGSFVTDNGNYGIYASSLTRNVEYKGVFKFNSVGNIHSNIRPITTQSSTISSLSGSLTSASGSIDWKRDGNLVFFSLTASITTNGSGAGAIFASLPFTARSVSISSGRANGLSGKLLQGYIAAGGSSISILNYDGTYPGASGETLLLSGIVEVY